MFRHCHPLAQMLRKALLFQQATINRPASAYIYKQPPGLQKDSDLLRK